MYAKFSVAATDCARRRAHRPPTEEHRPRASSAAVVHFPAAAASRSSSSWAHIVSVVVVPSPPPPSIALFYNAEKKLLILYVYISRISSPLLEARPSVNESGRHLLRLCGGGERLLEDELPGEFRLRCCDFLFFLSARTVAREVTEVPPRMMPLYTSKTYNSGTYVCARQRAITSILEKR